MKTHRLTSTGDTIVEVLIAVAVVSMIMASAFVVVNRSVQGSRQTSERGEALKLIEGQLEQLKSLSGTEQNDAFSRTVPFCLSEGAIKELSDVACTVSPDGPAYRLSITRQPAVPPSPDASVFSADARWDGLTGNAERVNLIYKMYR